VLFREAIALCIDREDGAVRDRLVRLGGFVGEDAGGAEALEEEARRLASIAATSSSAVISSR